jgi:LysW-gamma-L-lysine carboxypeptidase
MSDPVETLQGLLEHYSPSGSEAGAVDWLVGHMTALGYSQAFVDKAGNAVGVMGSGPRQIVLLGHIDTVPGEIELRQEGDLLYGRGSVDAKGPLATFVQAAARLGPQDGWQVVVIGALDEERDSFGARYLVDQYRPEFAVIGEPSRWDRLTLGYKGSASAEVLLSQPQAHSAAGQTNAPEQAFELWGRVKDWAEAFNSDRKRVFEQLQLNLAGFSSGGDAYQSRAALQIGARLPLDLSPQGWYAQLEALCKPHHLDRKGYAIPAYRCEKNTPLVRAFLSSVREQGGKPGFVLKTGTADMNIVAPVWGCPALAYGPGDSNLDHTPDEHVSVEEFRRAVVVLEGVLRRLLDDG